MAPWKRCDYSLGNQGRQLRYQEAFRRPAKSGTAYQSPIPPKPNKSSGYKVELDPAAYFGQGVVNGSKAQC
jgi:hypothetical protein